MIETVRELLEQAVNGFGEATAVRYKVSGQVMEKTYRELGEDVRYVGNAMLNKKQKELHVGVVGENSYDWFNMYFALLTSGTVFVPLSGDLLENTLVQFINEAQVKILVVGKQYVHKIEKIKAEIPCVEEYYYMDLEDTKEAVEAEIGTVKTIEDLRTEGMESKDYYSDVKIDKDAMAVIMFTSGTTSKSKGAMISHYNLATNCEASHAAFQFADGSVGLNILPMNHTYASMYDLLYTVYRHGILCICSSLKYMQKEIMEYKPNHIFLVPLIASKLMKNMKNQIRVQNIPEEKQNEFAKEFFGGNLSYLICGGAKLAGDVVEEYLKLGIHIYRGYGITECSPAVALTYAEQEYDYASVGSQIICDEIRIVEGEIQVKGSNIMLGYYKNEEATKATMDGEWFKTGDAGYMNEKGDLYVTGRIKNVIVLDNGKNVYPEEIEDLFAARPEVAETIAFEDENEDGKKVISVAIYPTDDFKVSEKKNEVVTVAQEIKQALPMYMRFSNVYLVEQPFEKTATNKIKRSCVFKIIQK